MTEKEKKQLLLVDLCARLPYGVKVQPRTSACPHRFIGYDKGCIRIDTDQRYELESIKPYLRPVFCMTIDERFEYNGLCNYVEDSFDYELLSHKVFDWLNAHHFDYRNLIDKGLAIEAPEGMYDLKTE